MGVTSTELINGLKKWQTTHNMSGSWLTLCSDGCMSISKYCELSGTCDQLEFARTAEEMLEILLR